MSRTTTPSSTPQSKPQQAQQQHGAQQMSVPHDKVSMRAYQKWVQRGCPQGTDKQDWHEAEKELQAEIARGGNASATQQKR